MIWKQDFQRHILQFFDFQKLNLTILIVFLNTILGAIAGASVLVFTTGVECALVNLMPVIPLNDSSICLIFRNTLHSVDSVGERVDGTHSLLWEA